MVNSFFLYQVDTVNNTQFIFLSQFLLCLYENIFLSKSHVTHLLALCHSFDCITVVSTLVQANRAKVIGTNLIVSFELNVVL